jgi:hypothetical protein
VETCRNDRRAQCSLLDTSCLIRTFVLIDGNQSSADNSTPQNSMRRVNMLDQETRSAIEGLKREIVLFRNDIVILIAAHSR